MVLDVEDLETAESQLRQKLSSMHLEAGVERPALPVVTHLATFRLMQHKQDVESPPLYNDRAWEVSLSDITEILVELRGLLVFPRGVLVDCGRQQCSSRFMSRRKRTPTNT